MTCPSAEELAALYDGVLPSKRASNIRSHLCICSRCSQEIKVLDRLLNLQAAAEKPSKSTIKNALQLWSTDLSLNAPIQQKKFKPKRKSLSTPR